MYTLVKRTSKSKFSGALELIGFETKINRHTINLYDQFLVDIIIKDKLFPEFNKIIKTVIVFLEADSDPDTAPMLLDELSRLYTVYLNKYEKFLSSDVKNDFTKNVHVLSNELKRISRRKKTKTSTISKGRSK